MMFLGCMLEEMEAQSKEERRKKENCCELLMNYHAGSEEEDPQPGRTMTRVAALLLKPHGQKERQKAQKVSSTC